MKKIEDLKGNAKNPRKISDEKIAMLEKSMHKFGDLGCVIFNRVTGQLAGGHQRLKVIPKDSQITIDTEYTEPTKTGTVLEGSILFHGEKFKYREVLWDQDTELLANIAANQQGGEWDYPLLNEHLLSLESMNMDMELTGFDKDDLKNLLAPVGEPGGDAVAKEKECPNCHHKWT